MLVNQAPFVLYAALIFAISSISKLPTPDIGLTFLDKVVHLFEYGLFSFLALRASMLPPLGILAATAYPLAMTITIVYAALDEYHQSFVLGRNADWYDLLADVIGALIALVICRVVKKRSRMPR